MSTPYTTCYTRYYYGFYGPHWAATTRNDVDLATDVHNRLVWDSWVNATQVNVTANQSVITLDGQVDSIVEKRAAGDDAWDTPGVIDVINNLKVKQPVMQP